MKEGLRQLYIWKSGYTEDFKNGTVYRINCCSAHKINHDQQSKLSPKKSKDGNINSSVATGTEVPGELLLVAYIPDGVVCLSK